MRILTNISLVVLGLLVSGIASAQTQVPNDFAAGTPARAAEVNANFDTLEAAIDDSAAEIAANGAGIANNMSDIQTLNASLAALGSGGTGLSVLFFNPTPTGDVCEFAHLPSLRKFWWSANGQHVYMSSYQNGELGIILRDVLTVEDSRAALVNLMIKVGNLNVAVDDFRDPSTNEFVCTNEKLLSIL